MQPHPKPKQVVIWLGLGLVSLITGWCSSLNIQKSLAQTPLFPTTDRSPSPPSKLEPNLNLDEFSSDPSSEDDPDPIISDPSPIDRLPPQFEFKGRTYTRQLESIPDQGRYWTDGSRILNHVIFWEVTTLEEKYGQGFTFPDPPPNTLYLLTVERNFIPYIYP